MFIDGWIKKMWYIYSMKYDSSIKENETIPFAATWVEMTLLSEVRKRKPNTI